MQSPSVCMKKGLPEGKTKVFVNIKKPVPQGVDLEYSQIGISGVSFLGGEGGEYRKSVCFWVLVQFYSTGNTVNAVLHHYHIVLNFR